MQITIFIYTLKLIQSHTTVYIGHQFHQIILNRKGHKVKSNKKERINKKNIINNELNGELNRITNLKII
jgi:hypothetical protein